jgi:hypothetical protein
MIFSFFVAHIGQLRVKVHPEKKTRFRLIRVELTFDINYSQILVIVWFIFLIICYSSLTKQFKVNLCLFWAIHLLS